VDIRRDDHDPDHHENGEASVRAYQQHDPDGDLHERDRPPGQREERKTRGEKLARPGVREHRDDQLHDAGHHEQHAQHEPERAGEPILFRAAERGHPPI
jgi:hypothetical protein